MPPHLGGFSSSHATCSLLSSSPLLSMDGWSPINAKPPVVKSACTYARHSDHQDKTLRWEHFAESEVRASGPCTVLTLGHGHQQECVARRPGWAAAKQKGKEGCCLAAPVRRRILRGKPRRQRARESRTSREEGRAQGGQHQPWTLSPSPWNIFPNSHGLFSKEGSLTSGTPRVTLSETALCLGSTPRWNKPNENVCSRYYWLHLAQCKVSLRVIDIRTDSSPTPSRHECRVSVASPILNTSEESFFPCHGPCASDSWSTEIVIHPFLDYCLPPRQSRHTVL
jgi:hypothetical protein